jgi:hypothetical protein
VAYQLDPDIVTITRQVYTYVDLLSAVGGFLGILLFLAKFLLIVLQFFTRFNDLTKSLVKRIFMMESQSLRKHESQIQRLLMREEARLGMCKHCVCGCDCRALRVLEVGNKRIYKELEVANFVKL